MSTGTGLALDRDDLSGLRQDLEIPRVAWLGARSALGASTGGPFLVRRIGRGGVQERRCWRASRSAIRAFSILIRTSRCWLVVPLLDDPKQLQDQLPPGRSARLPRGSVKRQSCGKRRGGSHSAAPSVADLVSWCPANAAFIAKYPEHVQQKGQGMQLQVTCPRCP